MRKKYEKPSMYIERFELNQSIAACDWDMSNSTDISSCNASSEFGQFSSMNIFANETACQTVAENYCYQNGNDFFNVFNS